MAKESKDFKVGEILRLAKECALQAGEFVAKARRQNFVDRQNNIENVKIMTKSNTSDVVTETDQKSEALITSMIRKRYPKHQIIGEESSSGGYNLTDKPTWIIDPIDGTTNFLHGFPYTCVLVSFAVGRKVVVAVCRDAIHDETFYATRGGGAFMESPWYSGRIRTSGCGAQLQRAYVMVDAGYGRTNKDILRFHSRCRELLQHNVQGIRVVGSCGLNMAYVACGRVDGYVEENCPKLWDFAPGSLLVEEAGGYVGNPDGSQPLNLMGRSVLCAATKDLALRLKDVVTEADKYLDSITKDVAAMVAGADGDSEQHAAAAADETRAAFSKL